MNKSDKMANWPMFKLLYFMSVPAIFSMLIQAMYNIVDTMYISKISEKALFTMGLVSPLQFISLYIALGTGIGCSTLISRKLGEGNKNEASQMATSGLILTIFHIVLVAILGVIFIKPFLLFFTKDIDVINMGFEYLSIVLIFNMGMFFEVFFSRLQQAQGNMIIPMFTQLIGAITNIILDPIFIFGGFGISGMGIKGAAIATVIGQLLSGFLSILINVIGNYEVKIIIKGFKLDFKRFIDIYVVGVPIMIMNSILAFTLTIMNSLLVRFDDMAVSVLNIYFKLQSFIFMPIFGFNQGCLPILSYNYGAKNIKRFKEAVYIFLFSAFIIMLLGTFIFTTKTEFLLSFFNPSDKLLEIGKITLSTISLSFVIAGVSIVISTIFQSLGNSLYSMMMSIFRQLVFLIPLSLLFGKMFGLSGVWYAYPVSEILVVLIYLPVCIKQVKKSFNIQ